MKKTILFDLDGTLLPMDAQKFEEAYIGSLTNYTKNIIDPKEMGTKLWRATGIMIKSDDKSMTNEQTFYSEFEKLLDSSTYNKILEVIDSYYDNDFDVAKTATGFHKDMPKVVRYLKDKGYRVILATNPMLPRTATDKRISWAGLNVDDFDHVTRFEEYVHCKPNPLYYEDIISKFDLDPSECLMVGNDAQEDMMTKQFGFETWLLTDDLIDRGQEYHADWIGTRDDLLEKIMEVFK